MISLIVDAQGNPQNPRVVRPLGMGLDEKALEAVRKYKFKPAHEGRQDAGSGHDYHRGELPALLEQFRDRWALYESLCRVALCSSRADLAQGLGV